MGIRKLPYRKVGKGVRASGKCSLRGTGNCSSDTTAAPLAGRCVAAGLDIPTTRARGRSSNAAFRLEAEGHPTRGDVCQGSIQENLQQMFGYGDFK
jgi:hypothetical protein